MPPLTKVLNGVTDARLILCDISSVAKVAGNPFRNGNVMYEVGIAHACRLPEEVLLFRSDRDDLLFDVTNTSSKPIRSRRPSGRCSRKSCSGSARSVE